MAVNCHPPLNLISWLSYTKSLTNRLKEVSGEAKLKILLQKKIKTCWWGRYFLGVEEGEVIQRDIEVFSGQHPCWFARSIIPLSTYENNLDFFSRLANESLGEIVFNNSVVQRLSLMYYDIDCSKLEYHWLMKYGYERKDRLWGRLSVFLINKNYFYLIEILLPALEGVAT